MQTVAPAPGALLWLSWGPGKGEWDRAGQPSELCLPTQPPPVPFLFFYQWDNRKDRH